MTLIHDSYLNHRVLPSTRLSRIATPRLVTTLSFQVPEEDSDIWVRNITLSPQICAKLPFLAVQYARAMGLRVIGIDTGAEKEKLVKKLGAEAWIDFKKSKDLVADVKAAAGGLGPHASIVVASHHSAYTQAVDYLHPTGTLVVVGLQGERNQ